MLQVVVESNVFDNDEWSRNRYSKHHPATVVYPMPGYRKMLAKHVPPKAYRAWFTYFMEQPENLNFTFPKYVNVHPRDHEWLLNELLL